MNWKVGSRCALAAAAVLCAVQANADLSIRMLAADGHGGEGGEYNVTPQNLDFVPDSITGGPAFETFCLEKTESVSFGYLYYANISTFATRGGAGGGDPDPLDPLTAYLYSEFIDGTLPGYVYDVSDGGIERRKAADDLQNVFWFIEQEQGQTWTTGDGSRRDQFYQLAVANAPDTIGDVRVVNLFVDAAGTEYAQDLLIKTPEPSSAALLAIGAAAVLRRRNRD